RCRARRRRGGRPSARSDGTRRWALPEREGARDGGDGMTTCRLLGKVGKGGATDATPPSQYAHARPSRDDAVAKAECPGETGRPGRRGQFSSSFGAMKARSV